MSWDWTNGSQMWASSATRYPRYKPVEEPILPLAPESRVN